MHYLFQVRPSIRAMKLAVALPCALATYLLLATLFSSAAVAKPQEVRVRSQAELSFGTFMVFGSGSRSVSAAGTVTDSSIVALEGSQPRPAHFTINYDRGNESRQVLDITVELVMLAPANMRFDGIDARLSSLETSLPDYPRIASGEPMTIRLTNCRTRVCSMSFSVGGRLDVTRNFGGAKINIPLNVDARIVARERL